MTGWSPHGDGPGCHSRPRRTHDATWAPAQACCLAWRENDAGLADPGCQQNASRWLSGAVDRLGSARARAKDDCRCASHAETWVKAEAGLKIGTQGNRRQIPAVLASSEVQAAKGLIPRTLKQNDGKIDAHETLVAGWDRPAGPRPFASRAGLRRSRIPDCPGSRRRRR